jgi:hypothetical protein
MIRFNLADKKLEIFKNEEEKSFLEITLISSTITNKFFIVTTFIENVSKNCPGFDEWFISFLEEYTTVIEKFYVIEKNVPVIKSYVDQYLKIRNIDFNQFVDESKAKKSSILFSVDEIEKIIKLSCYLKIYSLFFNSVDLKLDHRLHKKIYNDFANEVLNSEVINKIFNIIKTKTFRYNLTDKYMWDYIKMIQCKSIDVHIIEIFNFIMNSILILCEEDKNPITYFVSVVQESINWFLRSVYKGQIVYDDTVSTEDIHGSNVDNLKTYAYNDTLGRLKGIAFEQIYDNIERSSILLFPTNQDSASDESIVDFQNRISKIEYISPLCDSLVYPVLSIITSIPYIHFKTLAPDHAIVLSVYVQNLLRKSFKITEYRNLFSLLSYYPKKDIAIATTYKIKAMEDFVKITQDVNNFFGFKSKLFFANILGYFIGRISRVNFVNIFDGTDLGGVPLSRIETEMIQFYNKMFSEEFEEEFVKMKALMYQDF